MKKMNELLLKEIKTKVNGLDSFYPGSEEYEREMKSIKDLHEMYIKNMQSNDKWKWIDMSFKIATLAVELIGIGLPLLFYAKWMQEGFEFERDGTYTSRTFTNLFSRFKPTRK